MLEYSRALPRPDLKGGGQLRSARRPLNLVCVGPAVLWSFGPLAGGLLGSLDLRTIEACALISCESAAA